jgi:hypothetical protein
MMADGIHYYQVEKPIYFSNAIDMSVIGISDILRALKWLYDRGRKYMGERGGSWWNITSIPTYVFIARCLIKDRDNFNFIVYTEHIFRFDQL